MIPQVEARNLVNDYGPDDTVNPSGWAGSSGPSGSSETPGRFPGEELMNEVRTWLGTYILTATPEDLDMLTLWAAHTHLVNETWSTPRLLLDSPMPGSGKTTVLDHLNRLCLNPVQAASLSSPSLLARLLEAGPRTILIDEADRTLSPKADGVGELLAVLNSGYRRGASRPVLVPDKEEGWIAREMSTFGPVVMAGNAPDLPPDTRSRCTRVMLMPDLHGEVSDSNWQAIGPAAEDLGNRLFDWADSVRDAVANDTPELPDGLRGRNRERWEPLLRVARAAGGVWPAKCLELIHRDMEGQREEREAGLDRRPRHMQLLEDLRDVWPSDEPFMSTADLLAAIKARNPSYWGQMSKYGELTAQGMGRSMRSHFNLLTDREPTGARRRGYRLVTLEPLFARFCAAPTG